MDASDQASERKRSWFVGLKQVVARASFEAVSCDFSPMDRIRALCTDRVRGLGKAKHRKKRCEKKLENRAVAGRFPTTRSRSSRN